MEGCLPDELLQLGTVTPWLPPFVLCWITTILAYAGFRLRHASTPSVPSLWLRIGISDALEAVTAVCVLLRSLMLAINPLELPDAFADRYALLFHSVSVGGINALMLLLLKVTCDSRRRSSVWLPLATGTLTLFALVDTCSRLWYVLYGGFPSGPITLMQDQIRNLCFVFKLICAHFATASAAFSFVTWTATPGLWTLMGVLAAVPSVSMQLQPKEWEAVVLVAFYAATHSYTLLLFFAAVATKVQVGTCPLSMQALLPHRGLHTSQLKQPMHAASFGLPQSITIAVMSCLAINLSTQWHMWSDDGAKHAENATHSFQMKVTASERDLLALAPRRHRWQVPGAGDAVGPLGFFLVMGLTCIAVVSTLSSRRASRARKVSASRTLTASDSEAAAQP